MLRGSRGARTNPDADHLLARPARRSRRAGIGEDLAQLRALRLLHRDLSDLRPARRRARQPARPHLPDQGHAGERQAGVAAGGHPHRPLPVLPVLHDDLPLGRALHAPGRPRPALHRGDLHAALARPSAAPHARRGAAAAAAVPAGADWLQARTAFPPPASRASCRHARARPGAPAVTLPSRPAAGVRGGRRAPRPGRAPLGLRAAGAGARDQRGDDSAADPPWRRGGDRQRRGLLRRAGPSHGPRGPGAGLGAGRTSTRGSGSARTAASTR